MSDAPRYMVDTMWGYLKLEDALIEQEGPSEDGSITIDDLVVYAADHDTVCKRYEEEIKRLKTKVNDMVDSLYGQGFQVTGWHFNGEEEPMDNFFTDNGWDVEP